MGDILSGFELKSIVPDGINLHGPVLGNILGESTYYRRHLYAQP